ncbi:hypothetical protein N7507_010363 [Penicillium longicatenatum]|nr:hypothetical protein N7507_010363 [Penicillium longicatenatum]
MMSNLGQARAHAPPPSDPLEAFDDSLDSKSKEHLLLPEQADEPGFAIASKLTRGLQVPSRSGTCSSGFDYPEELSQHRISETQWSQFTQVIRDEAKLSRQQWTTVIGKGLGTLAIGGLMVGFFGAIPAVLVARHIRRRKEKRNLVSAMAGEQGERLAHHISFWNENFFQPRGLLIRVDLPNELLEDMKDMDLHLEGFLGQSDPRDRDRAALKARIVIIPLEDSVPLSRRDSETTLEESAPLSRMDSETTLRAE